MALYYSRNGHSDVIVNTGEKEKFQTMRDAACYVTEVQADGDELEAIRRQFTGIPMTTGRVVHWTGEMAKFIASNLK